MKIIKKIGLVLFLSGLSLFTISGFIGKFYVEPESLSKILIEKLSDRAKQNGLGEIYTELLSGKTFENTFQISSIINGEYERLNSDFKSKKEWEKVMYAAPDDWAYAITEQSPTGLFVDQKLLMFFLTFGLAILGGVLFILPDFKLLGPAGIKNNEIFQHSSTNRGWIGFVVFFWLVSFYILLYFFPQHLINQIFTVEPVAKLIKGPNGASSNWFLYGFMYCCVMTVMALRMFVKYRHNRYQIFRTSVVLFFQIVFAFLIPDIMSRFKLPWYDFKNAWPLDYDAFTGGQIDYLLSNGNIGFFMLFWGIVLTLVVVPVMVYFFGKRWYCSWVCGCGGLAETLGDPYRQLSDKSLKSWKLERWLVHGVLVFATLMTVFMLMRYFMLFDFNVHLIFFDLNPESIKVFYGFMIGSIFSGVIGTGFYPILGNRVWCRFGCPLAAYMGLIQRFKSRFRITTNGAQCISCGNCSTYCEQGIDVRWYAQRQQNIVRASCVGCGICSAVCPRGVLKLENGPEEARLDITKLPSIHKS